MVGWVTRGGLNYKRTGETFRADEYVHSVVRVLHVVMSKLIRLYTLNMYMLLCINYTLTRLFKIKEYVIHGA